MEERIRIKDIADKAGVSPGTVDRVLHKRGNVSKKAKEKVLSAIKLLDYSPNIIASALAYNKKWRVAALLPSEISDPFWSQPKDGLKSALKAVKDYGITLDFYHFGEDSIEEFESEASKVLSKDYQSVIISPIFTAQSIAFLKACDEKGIPYVQINTNLVDNGNNLLCYIGQDSYHSGNLGAKLLAFGLSAGEKAMICHIEVMVYNSQHLIDKEKGFRDYFSEHQYLDIEVVTAHFEDPYDEDGLVAFFQKHLKQNPTVKGIFVSTSRVFRAVKALRTLGVDNLKIVGFDLIDENLALLESEEVDFLINQNPYKQGYLALINVFNYFIRKIDPSKLQHLPLDVVMKENVSYYVDPQFLEIPAVL